MAKRTITGIVSSVSEKEWEDRNSGEDIILYSFQLEGNKTYFRTGTDDPGIDEGEPVRFAYEQKGNNANVDVDTIEVINESEVENSPPPKRRTSSGGRRSTGRSTKRSGSTSQTSMGKNGGEDWNARQKYWENKEKRDEEVTEPRITYSASQRDAVNLVIAALEQDTLSFGNAAKGAKFEMLLDYVDQATERFYNQRMNLSVTDDNAGDDDYDE